MEFECVNVPVAVHSDHGRGKQCQTWAQQHLSQYPADRVLGFNRIPELDYYYAAGAHYAAEVARERGILYHLTVRYRHYSTSEQAMFKPGMRTKSLMLTTKQVLNLRMYYHTENERSQLLPPGIYPDRKYSSQAPGNRERCHETNGITPDHFPSLQIDPDFSRKGVGRLIVVAAVPPEALYYQAQLFVAGQDKPRAFATQTGRMDVKENVRFSAGRDDAAHLMAAVNVLLHPAKQEAAGIVPVETIVADLLMLVTGVCRCASHIVVVECDVVLNKPSEQHVFDDGLHKVLVDSSLRRKWAKNAWYYADTQDLHSLLGHVADITIGELYGQAK